MAWLFWIVASGDMVALLALVLDTAIHPHGQFAGLVVALLLAITILLVLVMAGVALFRRPLGYAVGSRGGLVATLPIAARLLAHTTVAERAGTLGGREGYDGQS